MSFDGSAVEVSVADTGASITADFLPHVFDRFRQADASSTRAYYGLGLGLAIVRQLTELHGGSVRAASGGPGQGATFTLRFPAGAAPLPGEAGQDGYALLAQARAARPSLPAIAFTACAMPEDERKMALAGFNRYLPKPSEPGGFVAAVSALVRSLPSV